MPEDTAPDCEHTVEELGDRCLVQYVDVQCKATTAARYRRLLRTHIVPELGEMPVRAVEREHVAALHHALRETRGTANDVLWLNSLGRLRAPHGREQWVSYGSPSMITLLKRPYAFLKRQRNRIENREGACINEIQGGSCVVSERPPQCNHTFLVTAGFTKSSRQTAMR